MPDDVVWLTYEALAERLGIEKESARQRARRGMWARRKDNAGRLTVAVPVEVLEAPPEAVRDTLPDALLLDRDADHVADGNRYLNRYIEIIGQALEAATQKVAKLERERDEARCEAVATEKARAVIAAQVEALNTVLTIERDRAAEERRQAEERVAAERQRAEDWKLAADRFASQAERLAEAAATARRPWWRRLAG